MRKIDSPPYCFLETAIPVRHMAFDEHFHEVEVLRPYRFHSWWPAKDLAQLIKLAEGSMAGVQAILRSSSEKETQQHSKVILWIHNQHPELPPADPDEAYRILLKKYENKV